MNRKRESGSRKMYVTEINGIRLKIETAEGVFSPSHPDNGTLAMLAEASSLTENTLSPKILDLGCGAGIAGIYMGLLVPGSKIVMTDKDPVCAELSLRNALENGLEADRFETAVSDAFEGIGDKDFDLILSNPPYHTDFSVAKRFIEGSFARLAAGGNLLMVTKRLDWYKNKLINVFGGVKITCADGGYYVFRAEKRTLSPARKKPNKHRKP